MNFFDMGIKLLNVCFLCPKGPCVNIYGIVKINWLIVKNKLNISLYNK